MIAATAPRPSPPRFAANAAAAIGLAIWQTYKLGGRTWLAAPALVAIAVLPEFLQHVAEIQLGMFASADAFRAHAGDSLRWAFAIPKVIGLFVAIVMTARFLALGSVRRALLVPPGTLLRVGGGFAAGFVLAWPFEWLAGQGLPLAASVPLRLVSMLIQAGVTTYVAGAMLDDRTITLRRAYTTLLPTALIVMLLFAAGFFPGQALHLANHKLAMGQPAAIVWALMLFDSLWVGLLAALIGASLFVGYRTGLTWRGWTVHPARIADA